jgi:predicted nucleic acid-binding protein
VTVTRKLSSPIPPQDARDVIQTYRAWSTFHPTIEDIISASELEEKYQLSFWDSLIVIAAQVSGAAILVSEDLQDGQQIGSIKVTNPFK